MGYEITKKSIKRGKCQIVYDASALPGVKRVIRIVAEDIKKVFGETIKVCEYSGRGRLPKDSIVIGTIGREELIDEYVSPELEKRLAGKREVYSFDIENDSLVIAGSDKRGTIYGAFYLSSLLGVSPLTNWMGINPPEKEEVVITEADLCVTKEPSVKYRGFFINDEWPAFGNWCEKRFGGFNAKCYENVFELLLRLKGNYMWPAMWSAIFSNDGPGLDNAKLADEMGVVMGMSHHEPCLRNGEEYRYLRGKDSIYGDAWNFRTNEAGITRFWEDGLKRNGSFENVITVGMRGEADSTIMGKDATLKDNIDLLRDVLKCQNQLIKENVNENLDDVPRMLALYKEVEPFFYGDDNTQGLMDDESLEGVTLMLCDDNFGNLRTVPTESMRAHKGGYGMYYHFDYHGWPVSYEWVNSSYLPKIWEQMCEAFEFGIRDLWIVNVGDIFSTEYPLSFFLDLAYDYDKWGISNLNAPREYTKKWVKTQFGTSLNEESMAEVEDLLMAYTKIAASRRPEAINEAVYPFLNKDAHIEGENAFDHGSRCTELMKRCEALKESVPDAVSNQFFTLLYYPLMGNLNVHRIWTDTCINHYLADLGATYAEHYAKRIRTGLQFDKDLVDKLHTLDNGRWYGMGMSEHIGFRNWNEEECKKPTIYSVTPAAKPRVIALCPKSGVHTEGGDWTGRVINIHSEDRIILLSASDMDSTITIEEKSTGVIVTDSKGIEINDGIVKAGGAYVIKASCPIEGQFVVKTMTGGRIRIWIEASEDKADLCDPIIIEAGNTDKVCNQSGGSFVCLPEFGKYENAMKAYPVTENFAPGEGPYLEYSFDIPKTGEYRMSIYMSPSNPAYMDGKLQYAMQHNEGEIVVANAVPEGFRVGDDQDFWMDGVLHNIRVDEYVINANEGKNSLRIYAISPCFVLQRIKIESM